MRLSVPLISIVTFYLISIGTQAYGSTQDTSRCDLSVNKSCPQSSQAESEASQTPLILPDLSPTKEDLNDAQTDESAKTSDSNGNDEATTSTSTDSDDNDVADNSDGEQETNNNGDSKDNDENTGDGPSMIPFP
jgi:hypothetical protein